MLVVLRFFFIHFVKKDVLLPDYSMRYVKQEKLLIMAHPLK